MTTDAPKLRERVGPFEPPGGESSGVRVARELRGFGPLGILAIIAFALGNWVVLPLSAILVLVWAWRSRTAFDLTALAIIYWNLENDVAHLVFK